MLPGTQLQWVASVLPLFLLIFVLVRGPAGNWKDLKAVVFALLATSIVGSLLIDMAAGGRSLTVSGLSVVDRGTLLFAGFALSGCLYLVVPLTLTPTRLTVLVATGFGLGLALDPLLALVLVVMPMVRRQAPLQSVVAATIAAWLSGVYSWQDPGLFGHWIKATLWLPDAWLWSETEVQLTVIVTLLLLLTLHWSYVRYRTDSPRKKRSLRATLRSPNRWDWITFSVLLAALVVVQYTVPDIHDRMGKAVQFYLEGKAHLIREDWFEFIPWREVFQLIIGLAALWRRQSQQKNNFSFRVVFKALLIYALLFGAIAPFMTAAYENRAEWPTVIQLLYDWLGWIRVHWDPVWVLVFTLAGSLLFIVLPQFALLALVNDRKGVTGAKAIRKKGVLTPLRHVWWAFWLGGLPFVVSGIIIGLIFG